MTLGFCNFGKTESVGLKKRGLRKSPRFYFQVKYKKNIEDLHLSIFEEPLIKNELQEIQL